MINRKALFTFLALTFGLTLSIVLGVRFFGYSMTDGVSLVAYSAIGISMFIPGLSAILVNKFILNKKLKDLGFVKPKFKEYLKSYLLIGVIFILNYSITWVFISKPDFTLQSFLDSYNVNQELPLPAFVMVMLLTITTFVTAPILNMIPTMGEELGWRGFLLPALEPLGKVKASIYTGMIWGLWHTPMIIILGFAYTNQVFPGVLLHFLLATSLGIYMGYIWFKTRDTLLSGFIHAVFNAHAYGIWSILFISNSKILVGPGSYVGVGLLLIVGFVYLNKLQK